MGSGYYQYEAATKHCKEEDIYMIIDGDDGIVGTQTLKLYNHIYQTTDSWVAYGNLMHTVND